ncbi:MAG: aminotransferase class V-fold PLP-dependent enzyme [Tepidisphaeraceae bacterium]
MRGITDYIGNPQAFPILRKWDFLNHAGVSPLPRVGSEALRAFADGAESAAYLADHRYVDVERLRISAAAMLNAHRDEIAFVKNSAEGISIVANGLDWQWGDVIVTTAVEYPDNVYPWMEVVQSRGVKLVMVEEETDEHGHRHVPIDKLLSSASDPRCRLVTLSHVEYASGQRHDLDRIGRFCREHRRLFAVDAMQSMGVIPLDVRAMHIDYLSADGHKWLLGPEGTGLFFCRRELIERTRPLMIGWMNVVDAEDLGNYEYRLKPDAGRFECGTYNVAGLLALRASLELLGELGTGAILERLKMLTDRLCVGVQGRGYQLISPRGPGQWSGIVSFTSPAHNHEQVVRKLRKEHHIEIAMREGRLRASPHFYNTEQQIDRLIEALPAH